MTPRHTLAGLIRGAALLMGIEGVPASGGTGLSNSIVMPGSIRLTIRGLIATTLFFASQPAYAFSQRTLYDFTGKADGSNPVGGVVQDAAGNYYGSTFQGGLYNCPNPPGTRQGCGTIYRLAPDGTFTVLASFTGSNGAHGNSTPVLIGNVLYGTTALGGASNDGTIFSVHTDGTNFAVLHSFTGADGSDPKALAIGPKNMIYGVAENGGAYGDGTLFSISQTGSFSDLHDFNQPAGQIPISIVSASGTLVGSTLYGGGNSSGCLYGCGAIFTYSPATKAFQTVFSFPPSGADGELPYVGSVGPGPTIYGANAYYIFSLSAAHGFTNLQTLGFYYPGSGVASGPLYTSGGTLYGVLGGSASLTDGLAYSLLNGVFTDQAYLGGTSGNGPGAQPIINSNGSLVGTTVGGHNCYLCGAIWLSTPGQ